MAGNNRPLLEAILISNEGKQNDNTTAFPYRSGGAKNFENMKMIFLSGFGFQQINVREDMNTNVHVNKWDHKAAKTGDRVNNLDQCCLKCLIRGHDFSRTDCFLFCISTHGDQDNGVSFVWFLDDDDVGVKVNDIIDVFSDANCPGLAGKPRILMFDACRGDAKFPGNEGCPT